MADLPEEFQAIVNFYKERTPEGEYDKLEFEILPKYVGKIDVEKFKDVLLAFANPIQQAAWCNVDNLDEHVLAYLADPDFPEFLIPYLKYGILSTDEKGRSYTNLEYIYEAISQIYKKRNYMRRRKKWIEKFNELSPVQTPYFLSLLCRIPEERFVTHKKLLSKAIKNDQPGTSLKVLQLLEMLQHLGVDLYSLPKKIPATTLPLLEAVAEFPLSSYYVAGYPRERWINPFVELIKTKEKYDDPVVFARDVSAGMTTYGDKQSVDGPSVQVSVTELSTFNAHLYADLLDAFAKQLKKHGLKPAYYGKLLRERATAHAIVDGKFDRYNKRMVSYRDRLYREGLKELKQAALTGQPIANHFNADGIEALQEFARSLFIQKVPSDTMTSLKNVAITWGLHMFVVIGLKKCADELPGDFTVVEKGHPRNKANLADLEQFLQTHRNVALINISKEFYEVLASLSRTQITDAQTFLEQYQHACELLHIPKKFRVGPFMLHA